MINVAAICAILHIHNCDGLTERQQIAQRRLEMSPMEYEMDLRARNPDLWAAVQRDSARHGCRAGKPCRGQDPACAGNHGCVTDEMTRPEYFRRRK